MSVDIYDGKVLIDAINRTLLPVAQFPFVIGDELVVRRRPSVQDLIQSFRNTRSRRTRAAPIAPRDPPRQPQPADHAAHPRAGRRATVVIVWPRPARQHVHDPWAKNGIPILSQGPVPSPTRQRPDGRSRPMTQDITAGAARQRGDDRIRVQGRRDRPGRRHAAGLHGPDSSAPQRERVEGLLLDPRLRQPISDFSLRLPASWISTRRVRRASCRPGEPLFFLFGTFTTHERRPGRLPADPVDVAAERRIALAQLDRAMARVRPHHRRL